MHPNEELITRFYTAFAALDYKTMSACYSQDVVFSDPVFGLLQGNEVTGMWEMLCRNARDFSLEYNSIELLDEEYAVCHWVARYLFSQSGRAVTNTVKAHMRFANGEITEHTDKFDLWRWSRQALGLPGLLFGWSPVFQRRIQSRARKNLSKFLSAG